MLSPMPEPQQQGWGELGGDEAVVPALMTTHPVEWCAGPQRKPELTNTPPARCRGARVQHRP